MKYSILMSTLSFASFYQTARAIPTKRAGPSDVDILNFALTLEHLESTYYAQALAKYTQKDFEDAGFEEWTRSRYQQIAEHEKTHVQFLTSAITAAGAQAVEKCEYSFPDKDVRSFVDISEVLETVGTSAYNGALSFIASKPYLTVAASILGVEARQASWINSAVRKLNPWNTAFETPLGLNQAFTLASAFIKSCPSSNPPLPVKAFPSLSLPSSAHPGKRVTLTFDCPQNQKPLFAAFLTGTGTVFVSINLDKKQVVIPRGLIGTVYVIITDDGGKVTDETTVAGPAVVMFGFDAEGKVV